MRREGWTIYDHDMVAGYTVTDHGNVRVFSKAEGTRRDSIIQPYDFAQMIHDYLVQKEKPVDNDN